MVRVIQIVFACCAVLCGLDYIFGSRFGLGSQFENGFLLLGRVALSMAGIICLAPVLARLLGGLISPVYRFFGQDPGMFGSILSIDMGGYQMAKGLADDDTIGRFSGIVVASILGCTVSFTIPVGMGLVKDESRNRFARGILYGLICLPPTVLMGALLCGIAPAKALLVCVPVLIFALMLILPLWKAPAAALRGFTLFASGLKIITVLGLTAGAFETLTEIRIIPGMTPLTESMRVISVIGITLLGVLPFAELARRILHRPMAAVGKRLKIGADGVMTILILYLNGLPGLVKLQDLNPRAQTVAAALSVFACSALSAHFAFAMTYEPRMTLPMIATRFFGGALALTLSLLLTKKEAAVSEASS